MICIVTGEETKMLSHNFPVRRSVRDVLVTLRSLVNSKLKANLVEKLKEDADGKLFDESMLKLVEKSFTNIGTKGILRRIKHKEPITVEILKQLTGE